MSVTYTITTNFGAKDALPSGDSDKVIKGSQFTTEFTAIQTAFGLCAPAASPTFTGTTEIASLTLNGTPITATGAEINKLDGFTGTYLDLNYAKDLRATGVTATEFNTALDGITVTAAELNALPAAVVANANAISSIDFSPYATIADASFTGATTIGGSLAVPTTDVNTSSNYTLDASNTSILTLEATADLTLSFSNFVDGQTVAIYLRSSNSVARSITFPPAMQAGKADGTTWNKVAVTGTNFDWVWVTVTYASGIYFATYMGALT